MFTKKNDVILFSFFLGFCFSVIGKYYQFNFFLWFLGISFFAIMFDLIYLLYCLIRKVCLFIYENYIKNWWKAIQEGSQVTEKGNGRKENSKKKK